MEALTSKTKTLPGPLQQSAAHVNTSLLAEHWHVTASLLNTCLSSRLPSDRPECLAGSRRAGLYLRLQTSVECSYY